MAAAAARRERHERGPAKTEPAAALEALHAQLVEASEIYADGNTADQRLAVLLAVSGVYDMLINQGFSPVTLDPLFRPIDALEAQFLRTPDPLFAEKDKRGGVR
ncbi:hypothetical protein QP166_15190 [Sphingomonas sp. LR60]|uniref:hypothetical protein n=1 Tax=Sphingomonas sp. LR60 TaxID=3050233 RepID=UPI002FE0FB5F